MEFRLSPDDISAIRFGISPSIKLAGAVRTLLDPAQHPLHWAWVRGVRDHDPKPALALLGALIESDALPRRGELRGLKIGGRGVWRIGRRDLEVCLASTYDKTGRWIQDHTFSDGDK